MSRPYQVSVRLVFDNWTSKNIQIETDNSHKITEKYRQNIRYAMQKRKNKTDNFFFKFGNGTFFCQPF